MADIGIANCTKERVVPNQEKLMVLITTPATADSNDSVVVSTIFGSIDWIVAWDQTTGDTVTCTNSSLTLTIDASGGTTNHTYSLLILGDAAM